MKLLAILVLATSFSALANPELDKILGACKPELADAIAEAKDHIIRNSEWNYDRNYSVSNVRTGLPVALKPDRFSVYVYFNAEGLRDMGYVYTFKPVFTDRSRRFCDYVRLESVKQKI